MRALRLTWSSAWQEARANRRSFWFQVAIMVVNDLVWIVFWALFFNRVDQVRGWDLDQVIVLFAVLTTSAGLVLGLMSNVRRIGELVSSGGLDAVLVLPVPPLSHILSRRVETVHVGDVFFGPLLFALAGHPNPTRTAVFVFGVVCATLILCGFLVVMGSTAFLLGRNEAADLGFHAVLLFSSYPVDLYGAMTRVFLYAVIPAAFVTSVPARLVEHFSPGWAAATAAVAVVVAGLGLAAFTAGLRRYTSGAAWSSA